MALISFVRIRFHKTGPSHGGGRSSTASVQGETTGARAQPSLLHHKVVFYQKHSIRKPFKLLTVTLDGLMGGRTGCTAASHGVRIYLLSESVNFDDHRQSVRCSLMDDGSWSRLTRHGIGWQPINVSWDPTTRTDSNFSRLVTYTALVLPFWPLFAQEG